MDGAAHTVGGLLLVGGSTAAVGALVVTSQPQKLSLSLKLESCLLDDQTKVMTDTQRMRYMAGVFATFQKMVSEAKGFLATCAALIVSVPPPANISRDHRSVLYWNSVLFLNGDQDPYCREQLVFSGAAFVLAVPPMIATLVSVFAGYRYANHFLVTRVLIGLITSIQYQGNFCHTCCWQE